MDLLTLASAAGGVSAMETVPRNRARKVNMNTSKKSKERKLNDVDKKHKVSKKVISKRNDAKDDHTRKVITSKKSNDPGLNVDKKHRVSKKVIRKRSVAEDVHKSEKKKKQKTKGVDVDTIKSIVAEMMEQYHQKNKQVVDLDTDNDFENPMPETIQKRKRSSKVSQNIEFYKADKSNKKKKIVTVIDSDDTDDSDDGCHRLLRTRTSPKSLVTALKSMNQIQKDWLIEVGFGSILDLQIKTLPGHLGYYVVDNFNDKSVELKTKFGSIKITEHSVHEMLGIPNGDIQIHAKKNVNVNDPVTSEWRSQYKSRVVRLKEIVEKLGQSEVCDRQFQLNFLVLFVSVMGECTKQGGSNQKFLPCIIEDVDIKKLNWCGYIYECLKNSKKLWNKHKLSDPYAGPLTLLMLLYVDGVKCSKVPVVRQRPALKGWTTKLLKNRESTEVKCGGFGMGEIVTTCDEDQDDEVDVNINKKSSRDDEFNIYTESLDKESTTIEGYLHSLEVSYIHISDEKAQLESILMDALKLFPANEEISRWNDKVNELFGSKKERHGSNVPKPKSHQTKNNIVH